MMKIFLDILQQYTGVVGVALVVGFISGIIGSFSLIIFLFYLLHKALTKQLEYYEKRDEYFSKQEVFYKSFQTRLEVLEKNVYGDRT